MCVCVCVCVCVVVVVVCFGFACLKDFVVLFFFSLHKV